MINKSFSKLIDFVKNFWVHDNSFVTDANVVPGECSPSSKCDSNSFIDMEFLRIANRLLTSVPFQTGRPATLSCNSPLSSESFSKTPLKKKAFCQITTATSCTHSFTNPRTLACFTTKRGIPVTARNRFEYQRSKVKLSKLPVVSVSVFFGPWCDDLIDHVQTRPQTTSLFKSMRRFLQKVQTAI